MERNCEVCEKYVTSEDGKTKGCSQWYCDKFTVTTEECINTFEGMKRGVFPWVMDPYCDKAISALRQYDGMTNGEVIEEIYRFHSDMNCGSNGEYVHVWSNDGKCQMTIHKDFWNAPYQKGGAE